MVSGEYLSNQPFFIPVTPSKEMRVNILNVWNRDMYDKIVGGSIGNSMINEPFNQHLTIFSEGGIFAYIGLLVFLYCIFKYSNKNKIPAGILLFFFISTIFLTNNWFAFPNFAMVFWLTIRYIENSTLNQVKR